MVLYGSPAVVVMLLLLMMLIDAAAAVVIDYKFQHQHYALLTMTAVNVHPVLMRNGTECKSKQEKKWSKVRG